MLCGYPLYESLHYLVRVRYSMLDPDTNADYIDSATRVTMRAYTPGAALIDNVKDIRTKIREQVGTRPWDFASLSAIRDTVRILDEHVAENHEKVAAEAEELEGARYAVRAFLEARASVAEDAGYDPDVIHALRLSGPQTFRLKVSDLEALLKATS